MRLHVAHTSPLLPPTPRLVPSSSLLPPLKTHRPPCCAQDTGAVPQGAAPPILPFFQLSAPFLPAVNLDQPRAPSAPPGRATHRPAPALVFPLWPLLHSRILYFPLIHHLISLAMTVIVPCPTLPLGCDFWESPESHLFCSLVSLGPPELCWAHGS